MASQWETFFLMLSGQSMPVQHKDNGWKKGIAGKNLDHHIITTSSVWVLIPGYHWSYENGGEVAAAKQKEPPSDG